MGHEGKDHEPETIFERMEVTVAELLVWIAAWELLSTAMTDVSKKTKLIVYAILFFIALFIIVPVYRKRLVKEHKA